MNVNLTPQLENFVKAKVDSGLYNSASEVVRDALRLLEEQDQFRQAKLDALRKEIQKGFDSGPAESWDVEDTLRRAHERHAAREIR